MSDEQPKEELPHPFQPLGRDLRREDFTPERVRRIAEATIARGGVPLMSEEARRASLKMIRQSVPADQDAWVFGYGSLMWNPAINVLDSRRAHLRGYHRIFALTLKVGRGSAEQPGLMLGIDRGGSCSGIAHRIAAADVESELSILWMREMLSGAYEPRFVSVDVEGLGRKRVLTFVINRYHPRYEGLLDEFEVARRIACAQGPLGTNREYLYRTIQYLRSIHIDDGPMRSLESRVRTLANELHKTGE